ncbi:type VI secretion system-associated FHA domain protein TagH [Methylomonas sp. AM2-LC]|uniref:type VI secretion system-associated FHA domain protein TagH n=1 Tax=Methylomonas sp. AM2-LC TaxID=3153301 RepID=UPI00326614BF
MRLVLKVITYKSLPVSKEIRVEYSQDGGSIGRKADRTMVLEDNDKIVSGQHADIYFANGHFFIKDTSSNGTYLVKAGLSLSNAEAVLQPNEVLRIGEYEILVDMLADEPAPIDLNSFSGGPFANTPAPFAERPMASPQSDSGDFASFLTGIDTPSAWGDGMESSGDLGVFSQRPFSDDFESDLNAVSGLSGTGQMHSPFSTSGPAGNENISNFLAGIDAIPAFGEANSQLLSNESLSGDPFASSTPSPVFSSTELNSGSVMHDNFTPPAVFETPLSPAPDMANFFAGLDASAPNIEPKTEQSHFETVSPPPIIPVATQTFSQPTTPPTPAFVAPPVVSSHASSSATPLDISLMQQFLTGAGIRDANFLPADNCAEAMKTAGILFRLMVEGLMDVLRARAEMKSEFRVSVTTLRSVDNNPLKFNPDVESVLKLLMGPHNSAFIKSEDAVKGAFKDIKYHQLAMTAGIQASLAEILHKFDPDGFEKVYAEGLVFQKKTKCWELYCEKYPEFKSMAMEEFFGEEFADAYEKQMQLFARS